MLLAKTGEIDDMTTAQTAAEPTSPDVIYPWESYQANE
jgi:hypothetical protein